MIRKVIGLWGKGTVGKSQTIKKVYSVLTSKYKNAKEEQKHETNIDIKVVLTIGKTKIGIESQGDPGSRLEDSLKLFVRFECAVIVCATRTSGQTVEAVKKLQPDYKILWLEQIMKSTISEQQASNSAMAQRLVEEVEKAIGA